MPTFKSPTLDAAASHRPAARISPTSRGFVLATVIVTGLAFAAAFAISTDAQVWVGAQLGLPVWERAAVPLAIDAPLVAFGLGVLARRARGERVWTSMAWLVLFTLASIGANVWHGLAATGSHGPAAVGVAAIACLVPVAVLATSEQVMGILIAPPSASRAQLAAIQRVADRHALPAQSPATAKPSPKRGTPQADDLDAAVRDAKSADPGLSKAALAARFGLSAQRVREALNGA